MARLLFFAAIVLLSPSLVIGQRIGNGAADSRFKASLAKQGLAQLKSRGADEIKNPEGLVLSLDRDNSEKQILEACKQGLNWQPWLTPGDSLKVGQVGRLRLPRQVHGVASHDHADVEIFQVISNETAIVRFFGSLYWLQGVKTEKFVDGDKVLLLDILEVIGTHRYKTAAGSSSTILKLEKNDLTRKVDKAKAAVAADPPRDENIIRRWHANKKQYIGRVKSYRAGVVTFEGLAGGDVDVKTKDLSKESRKKLSKVRKAMRSPEK